MSATNHTGNYNLPIYEAGNTANWLVDFNGAMSTIDLALNENKLAGDTLKTDMEGLQTDFQQVSTKADAAEQAATQASTNAANALTIANNATTIAGDAQVDAHAALTMIQRMNVNSTLNSINTGEHSIFARLNIILNAIGCIFMGGIHMKTPYNEDPLWTSVAISNTHLLYYNGVNLYENFKKFDHLPTLNNAPITIFMSNTLGLNLTSTGIGAGNFSYGFYIKSSNEIYFTLLQNVSLLNNPWIFILNNFSPRRPLLEPVPLLTGRSNEEFIPELYRPYILDI